MENSSTITQSYAEGPVSAGSSSWVGGLVGISYGGAISESYATGKVVVGSGVTGGLVAQNSAIITNSYWDILSTGQPTSSGGIGEATAQLKSGLPIGFDPTVWTIVPSVTYPYLLWEPTLVFGFDSSGKTQPLAIDWASVASSEILYKGKDYPISFAILRASKGASNVGDNCQFEDSKFVERATAASEAGLLVGAYHVLGIKDNVTNKTFLPESEADYFVQVAGEWLKPGNIRPFLDVEDDPCYPNRTQSMELASWVDRWMIEVHNLTGITPIIYTNSLYVNNLQSLASQYELWVAENPCVRSSTCDPAAPPRDPKAPGLNKWKIDLVQYNWFGQVAGVQEKVDLDAFQGPLQAFQSELIIGR
jgi:GH25 family lysozyme M1 (1,4-beta-N-acetylmuramidase)